MLKINKFFEINFYWFCLKNQNIFFSNIIISRPCIWLFCEIALYFTRSNHYFSLIFKTTCVCHQFLYSFLKMGAFIDEPEIPVPCGEVRSNFSTDDIAFHYTCIQYSQQFRMIILWDRRNFQIRGKRIHSNTFFGFNYLSQSALKNRQKWGTYLKQWLQHQLHLFLMHFQRWFCKDQCSSS